MFLYCNSRYTTLKSTVVNESFPLAVHSAYQDLLSAHTVRSVGEISGKPFLRKMGAKGSFWYAIDRIGGKTVQQYIGADTAEVREKIEKANEARADEKMFRKHASSLVAQLRAAGLPALDRQSGKVLHAMVKSGVFRLGGTLVGTHAFRLYSAELGARLGAGISATEDIDIAAFENLKLVIDDEVDPALPDTFRHLNLEPAANLDRKGRTTTWKMKSGGLSVDFLVPKMKEGREVRLLKPLGVHAQALPFLNYLIAEPINAAALYRSGLLVQIPRPERFAVHKLIVASRRHTSAALKAKKDLAQAEALSEILAEDRPDELAQALEDARAKGPNWRKAINQSLCKVTRVKAIFNSL